MGLVDRQLIDALIGPQLEELRAEEVFEQQARRACGQMMDMANQWPSGLQISFDGPMLGQVERQLYLVCSYRADDGGYVGMDRRTALDAAGLQDTGEDWLDVLRAVSSLKAAGITMALGRSRREFRFFDEAEVSEDGEHLKLKLGAGLLSALRGEGATPDQI